MTRGHFLLAFSLLFLSSFVAGQDIPATEPAVPRSKSIVRGHAYYEDSGMPVRRGLIGVVSIDDDNFPRDPNVSIGNDLAPDNWFLTGDDGAFEIKDLKAGKYYIAVNVPNVLSPQSINRYFGGDRSLSKRRLDDLFTKIETDGINVIEIQVPVKRGASIAGNIIYFDKTPAVHAQVELFRQSTARGEDAVVRVKKLAADDRGYFRFTDLPPGTYFVSATEFATHGGSDDDTYQLANGSELKTFYPHTRDLSKAEGIDVGWGTPVKNLEIEIPDQQLHKMSGVVFAIDTGKPRKNATVEFERIPSTDSDSGFFDGNYDNRVVTGDDGAFLFKDLPSGKYRLKASLCATFMCDDLPYAETIKEVEIGSNDVSDVVVELRLAATFSGSIELDADGTTPKSMVVGLVDIEKKNESSTRVRTHSSSEAEKKARSLSFKVSGVSEGNYLLSISLEGDQIVKSVFVGAKDVTNQKVDIKEGEKIENVRIVLTKKFAILRGKALVSRDVTAVATRILLVPVERSKQDSLVSSFDAITDLNGEFEIKAAPGEYFIAYPTRLSNRLTDKDWLDKVVRNAQKVTLTIDKPADVSLTVKELK